MPDHVHMLIAISPKYSVSQVIGFIKANSAISIAWAYLDKRKTLLFRIFGHEGILF